MDNLSLVKRSLRRHLWLIIILENIIFGFSLYISINFLKFKIYIDFCISSLIAIFFIALIVIISTNYIIQPLKALWQSILHLSPNGNQPIKAPDLKSLSLGQELVTNLVGQLYEIARVGHESALKDRSINSLNSNFIANSMPLPLFILDNSENIKFVNKSAADYIGINTKDLIDKNFYSLLDMSFPSEDTLDKWLTNVKQKTATASKSWERVRLDVGDSHPTLLFDLAAYYNQGNIEGNTTMVIFFDHTKQYSQDDQAISFIALSVHELRTPLTLLRGYIEVFEEELKGKTTPEIEDYINKMHASSEQLTAFVNNILNVARVDNDQLELKLQSEDWSDILTKSVDNIRLRAIVRSINLELNIDLNLPKVAADRLSIQEVINNLVDNAIKYSNDSKVIKINSRVNSEGLVETDIQDFGVGISSSIMPNLFTKFYRDHRNRSQIGGTGLGLYLSKAIVTAHGGNLWVRSEEGKGSTFSFTLIPYDQLSKNLKEKDDKFIRSAHGWIKNHSYYRR